MSYMGSGNTYYNDSTLVGNYCFQPSICDAFANIQLFPVVPSPSSSVSVSSLPSFGISSVLVVLAVLFGVLI